MFKLTQAEWGILKSQFVTSSWGGSRKPPSAFTEQGLAMSSVILNSDKAIEVNINIMRAFVAVRKYMVQAAPSSLSRELEEIKERIIALDEISEENEEKFDDIMFHAPSSLKKSFGDDYFLLTCCILGKNSQ